MNVWKLIKIAYCQVGIWHFIKDVVMLKICHIWLHVY